MTEEKMNEIIGYEIIVDCHDEDEIKNSWFHYLQDELRFPFEAEIAIKNRGGKESMMQVDVLDLSDSNLGLEAAAVILDVSEKGSDKVMDVSISKLENVKGNQATMDAVAVWKHWESGKFKF